MNFIYRLARNQSPIRSLVPGALATILFYVMVQAPIFHGSALLRCTTEHVTEYAIVALFFWVNVDLFLSFLNSRMNQKGIANEWIPARSGLEEPTLAGALLDKVRTGPRFLFDTMISRRLRAALTFVNERQSIVGFREYLNDLAARDVEEVLTRYSFPKFITALLPILGLLGTVVHFGSSLSGLTLDGLTEKIPEIVGGIGTAFSTTCTALTASISTMIIRFLIERQDELQVLKIDSFMEDELLHRFTASDSSLKPFLDALSESQQTSLVVLGQFEQRLAQEWSDRLARINEQVIKTDKTREDQFRQLLKKAESAQQAQILELQGVRAEFKESSNLLLEVADALNQDGHLQQLQEQLVQNLTALRQSQQFENAMHELTGAIHLLTARHSHTSRAA